jgi:hypothetical protein
MESYFLSETVKYLYLSFVDSGPLLDYYLLSTEGHLMPAYPHASDRHLIEADLQQQQQQQEEQQEHDEEGLEVDQGGMWGDLGDCDDNQQQQQQQQDSEAEQQQPSSSAGSFTLIQDEDTNSSGSNVTAADADGGSGSGVGTTSGSLVGKPLGSLPANCRGLCELRSAEEEAGYEARLHAALPLLPVRRVYSRRIR